MTAPRVNHFFSPNPNVEHAVVQPASAVFLVFGMTGLRIEAILSTSFSGT